MRNTFTILSFCLIALFSIQTKNVDAQTACCPDFFLSDAVEICPTQGACVHDSTSTTPDPAGQFMLPISACKETYHTYTIYPNDPTYTYTWTVTGGTASGTSGNPMSILWGNSNQGTITVIINDVLGNGFCSDTIFESICLVDGPQADFSMSEDTVCTNTDVTFYNMSLGGSVYFWDFGDGTTSSLAVPPPHSYDTPGTYTVVLSAQDMGTGTWVISSDGQSEFLVPCGCVDTVSYTIVVLPGDGPVIDTDCCYGTVCAGDTSSFCTSMACGSYNWDVTGGTIVSGAGTSCITVQWDATYSVPTTVSLESCPGMGCIGTTIMDVPVLYPNLPISGPVSVCVGASGSYSLPTLPGTYYNWSVSGLPTSFNQADRNVTLVNITFNYEGTYWVKCEYDNPLSGCNGVDSIQVEVTPPFNISGAEKVCEGSISNVYAAGDAIWTISPAGSTIQSGNGTSAISVLWGPGNYTVSAMPVNPSLFCTPSASIDVEVVPLPILNSIAGPDSVCLGEVYTYNVSSDTPGSFFTWSISSGTGTILSEMGDDKDSVAIEFSGVGPWTVSVYQEVELSPGVYCQSLTENFVVEPFTIPTITGVTTVCIDAVETYVAVGSTAPGGFEWTISPATQGTIQFGQGTNSVDILWHGPPTTATLTVTTCSGSSTYSVVVNGPPNAIASYSTLPVFCAGVANSVVLSTPSGVGYSFQWYEGVTPIAVGGTLSTYPVIITAATPPGIYKYKVVVTLNGCSVTSNVIDVVVENCASPGSGTGGSGTNCDVYASFIPYVVCADITLVNMSTATGGITGYSWSISGPGTGTFLPNANVAVPTLSVSASGTYTLYLTVTSAMCSLTYQRTFDVLLPTATFTYASSVCQNSSVFFTATPNDPDFNYFWTFGDGSTSYDPVTEHAYSVPSPPTYNPTLVITDDYGCVATSSGVIVVDPAPNCSISAPDTVICPGDFAVLTTCSAMASYQWFLDGIIIPGANADTYNATQYGEYTVEIMNSNSCRSESTNSVFIYVSSPPKAEIAGDRHYCVDAGSSYGFSLSSYYSSDYTYTWTSNLPGVVFSPPTGWSTWVIAPIPAALPMIVEFYVDVTDTTTGCMSTDTLCVTFFEKPIILMPFMSVCEGDSLILNANPADPTVYGFQWSNGATTPGIIAKAAGFYNITITNLYNGCSSDELVGAINPKPDLKLFPLGCRNICPDSIQLYIPLPLNATWPNNNYGTAYPTISWYDNGDYTTSIGSGELLNFPSTNSGPHQISVVVVNSYGCSDTSAVFCIDDVCCELIVSDIASGNASCPQNADGWFTVGVDPSSTGGPYTLTSSPLVSPLPVVLTPGVPITITGLAVGSYTFTISDSNGDCVQFASVYISAEQEECCFAATDSSFVKITSDITYTSDVVWDGKYYIDNNVTVTVDAGAVLDITVVDVVFGECAGIVFQNGGRLRATNSVFRPCDIDGTWKGLRFEAPGEFDNVVNESTFKNAEAALYFLNGADAVISNNLFANCNNGVRVEGNNSFSHPISGNRFVTDHFFPNYACTTMYSFVSNFSTYGIYSTDSRFQFQVSHNDFIDSKQSSNPRTYGIYQTLGGGLYSENTFTDLYNSVWLQSQMFYTAIENNEFEINIQPNSWFPSIYVNSCSVPIIEINNNEISNNYNQFMSYSGVYTVSSSNVSIVNNEIEGFNFGILSIFSKNSQISNNNINEANTYGIYVYEQANSQSYITCNSIKMRNFIGTGIVGFNLAPLTEVSSNCITDCNISMDLRGFAWGGTSFVLPVVRNNFLYNYNTIGINVQGLSGNIGTVSDPGMNTLYSNNNAAIDINSNTTIYVADNFGMFNISFPEVQITSNNPYHSTASCGHQIYNMPSQGNLNVEYTCDNFVSIADPLVFSDGSFKLMDNYQELLISSNNQFDEANMVLSCLESADENLMNEVINITELLENEKALLKYNFYYRNADYTKARTFVNLFNSESDDEDDFVTLSLYDLDIIENGWSSLSETDIQILVQIAEKESIHSNYAITLLNNTASYRDHIVTEPMEKDVELSERVKNVNEEAFLDLWPNPTSGKVFVELISNSDFETKLEIFDVSGKLVKDYNVNFVSGAIEIDVENLGEGFYFITLTDSTGYVQKGKFVKVNE